MRKAVSTAALFAGLLISSSALACSCALPSSPRQHIDSTDVIFEGKVTARTKSLMASTTTFDVVTTFKGEVDDIVTINHATSGAACGYTFDEDYTGLVFASYVDGKLLTNLCRMMPVDQDSEGYRQELGLAAGE